LGETTKTCTKCNQDKPVEEYHRRSDTGKLRSWCKVCHNTKGLSKYHNDPHVKSSHRLASRRSSLKKYGLDEAKFDEMFRTQSGTCKICGESIEKTSTDVRKSACVDHCHTTGVVRGLLCWDCNVGLGKFKDVPQLLINAARYLETTR
jgi:hypothetical protein